MAKVLTQASTVECGHQGPLALVTNSKLKVNGNAVVIKVGPALDSTKCKTENSSSTKKCTSATVTGGTAAKLKAGGSRVFLDSVSLTTDGNPVGKGTVSANQNKLIAS